MINSHPQPVSRVPFDPYVDERRHEIRFPWRRFLNTIGWIVAIIVMVGGLAALVALALTPRAPVYLSSECRTVVCLVEDSGGKQKPGFVPGRFISFI